MDGGWIEETLRYRYGYVAAAAARALARSDSVREARRAGRR